MYVARRTVGPALAPFVASLGYYELDSGELGAREPGAPALEVALPIGSPQLVINLAGDENRWYDGPGYRRVHGRSGAAVCGLRTGPIGLDTAQLRRLVCVAFHPGGSFPFFAAPAAELTEPLVDLAELCAVPLRELLLEAASPAEALRRTECVLTGLRTGGADPLVSAAVRGLSAGHGVRALSERLGVTERTLVRRFTPRVGLTPKRFARIARLQAVLRVAGPDADWAGIAARCGYFDQSHLVHEFRALTGMTPGAYRPRSAAEPNHVPVP